MIITGLWTAVPASVGTREKRPPAKAVKRFDERMVYPVALQTEAATGYAFNPERALHPSARIERLEDTGVSREMSRAVQRRATSWSNLPWKENERWDLVEFLVTFIDELNALAEEGSVVLVEGKRDSKALVDLGYRGRILTKSSLAGTRFAESLAGTRSVVILTDMDREGRRLASAYVEFFRPLRIKTLLGQRRRLKRASHGVFRHIENLSRFAPEVPELRTLRTKMSV